MKIKIQFLALLVTLGMTSFIAAELCDSLYFTKGASYEMENYSKGKKTGVIKQVVKEVTTSGGKTEAKIHMENFDMKNEKNFEGDFKYVCEGDKIKIDAQSLLASLKQPGMENMDMKIEESYFEYPLNPSTGQKLEDMKFTIIMSDKASGQEFARMKMTFENRKVEGKEKVTTPAGAFDCWKVNADVKMEMTMMGSTRTMPAGKSVDYYNKEMGSVKSETIGKDGKVEGYSVLSKYSKK